MLSWHRIPYKDSGGMFLGRARQAGLCCCQALRGCPTSAGVWRFKKGTSHALRLERKKGQTCENLIINTLEKISTHTCIWTVVCWSVYFLFLHQRKRRGDSHRSCRGSGGGGGSVVQEGEARGGWGRQREAWNRPVATVQQACIGECCVCAAGHTPLRTPDLYWRRPGEFTGFFCFTQQIVVLTHISKWYSWGHVWSS